MKYFLLLPNGIQHALLGPSETLFLIPPLCFQYTGFFFFLHAFPSFGISFCVRNMFTGGLLGSGDNFKNPKSQS